MTQPATLAQMPHYLTYDRLKGPAKLIARQQVMDDMQMVYESKLNVYRTFLKSSNIHWMIKNRHTYKALVQDYFLLKKCKDNPGYFERFILENVSNFLPDGTYILYRVQN
jgi:hypothetical protein